MPVAAIVGGSLIGAASSIYGSNQAANATDRASRHARDTELAMYNQNRADQAPYREAGVGALGQIQDLYSHGGNHTAAMNDFFTSPQYEFTRSEGLRGIQNTAAARGGGLGSNALRGMTQFSSGLASGEFSSYVDRLFNIAGIGQQATNTTTAAGANSANNIANIYQNQGNARASAYMTGAQGVNSAIQGGLQNWAFNTYMNRSA